MPLRAYEPLQTPCRLCGSGFECAQQASEPPLAHCPKCGQPVRLKIPTAISSPRLTRSPSASEAKAAGFTLWHKTSDGSLEKQ